MGCFEREESEMCVLCIYAGTVFISRQIGMSFNLVKNPWVREDPVGLQTGAMKEGTRVGGGLWLLVRGVDGEKSPG